MNQHIGQLRDLAAKESVQIQIQKDGLVIWINIDGVFVILIMANGTIPIEVEDGRK